MSTTEEQEESTFYNHFGKWVEENGVHLVQVENDREWSAMIDLNRLKTAFLQLMHEKQAHAYRDGFKDGEENLSQHTQRARADERKLIVQDLSKRISKYGDGEVSYFREEAHVPISAIQSLLSPTKDSTSKEES